MDKSETTVYFKGFPENTSNQELETEFAQFGPYVKFFIHKSRRYGMIEYIDISSCVSAIHSLRGKPPFNLYLNLVNRHNDKKETSPKMITEPVTYREEEVYVDENNTIVNFLFNPDTKEVYVPIRYAPNIKKIIKKTPILNGEDDISNSNPSRKIKYDNNSLDFKVERSFTTEKSPTPPNKNGKQSFDKKIENTNRKFDNFKQNGKRILFPPGNCDKINIKSETLLPVKLERSSSFSHPTGLTRESLAVKEKIAFREGLLRPSHSTSSHKTLELPKNIFTSVRVEHVINDHLGWVQIVSKSDDFETFMAYIISILDAIQPIKPELGKIGLAQFEENWFRAVVIKIIPKVVVRFIDFGNESVLQNEFLPLPQKYSEHPGYAICIKLADGAPCKMENGIVMSVKPVKTENNMIIVQVENGLYGQEPETAQSFNSDITSHSTPTSVIRPKLPDSLAKLHQKTLSKMYAGMIGFIDITLKLSKNKVVAFFYPEILCEELVYLESLEPERKPNFNPQVGDLICAQDKKFCRGLLLSAEPNSYEVAFIDYGIIKTVSRVYPLPNDSLEVFQFSCVFSADENILKTLVKTNANITFKITSIKGITIFCKFDFADKDIPVTLWNPNVENYCTKTECNPNHLNDSSLDSESSSDLVFTEPSLQVKDGDEIDLLDEQHGFLLVRTKEGFNLLGKITNMINNYAPKAPKLQKPPVCGQMVLSEYENVWYRAVILDTKASGANILYIDFGNEEVKPFFSLKDVTKEMLKTPATFVKIKLKNNVNFDDEKCAKYMSELASQSLIVSLKDGLPKNTVDLILRNGKSLSDELLKLTTPPTRKGLSMNIRTPGKDDPKITSICLEDIPLGDTEIKYLYPVDIEANLIAVTANRPDILHKIQVDLKEQITTYATDIAPKKPYIPIKEELILAQIRDKWYRGMCIEIEEDSFTVFFIDYGFNADVTADRIRQIPAEFVQNYKALANFALIDGLPPNPSQELMDRLENLLLKNEVYKVKVLQKDSEDTYLLSFPNIIATLKQEKLM